MSCATALVLVSAVVQEGCWAQDMFFCLCRLLSVAEAEPYVWWNQFKRLPGEAAEVRVQEERAEVIHASATYTPLS